MACLLLTYPKHPVISESFFCVFAMFFQLIIQPYKKISVHTVFRIPYQHHFINDGKRTTYLLKFIQGRIWTIVVRHT